MMRTLIISLLILCSTSFVSSSARTPSHGHRSAKRVQRKAAGLPSRITIYYLSFDADTFAALSPKELPSHSNKMVITNKNTILDIYSFFARRGRASKFDKQVPRLLIEPAGRKGRILVDQDGNVLIGRKQFALEPFDYLRLYLLLEGLYPQTPPLIHYTPSK